MKYKTEEQLSHMLKDMMPADLVSIIDEDYYRAMIGCRPEDHAHTLDALITELVEVQDGCAKANRFDLAVVCRGKLNSLAMQMKIEDLV